MPLAHQVRFVVAAAWLSLLVCTAQAAEEQTPNYRSPVDLVLSPDEAWLITANQTSSTVSLVNVASGKVVAESPCARRPTAIAYVPQSRQVLAVGSYGGEVTVFSHEEEKLTRLGAIPVSFEPYGIAVHPDGKTAYVSQSAGSAVAVLDLANRKVAGTIAVGPWPRSLVLSHDGGRLAVTTNGDRNVFVIDTAAQKVLFEESFGGINAGQMCLSPKGDEVYFPWMVYRHNPIDQRNIREGWVLGSRIGRVRIDKATTREAITLDPQGEAVSDPHGMGMTSDGKWLVCAAAGTHELLVYRTSALVFQSIGGPGDHIDPALRHDRSKFYRVPLGGRPMGLRMAKDNRRVFVSNYLTSEIHEIDLETKKVARHIQLGPVAEPTLARQGEAIFYDGARSLDQWYSCHSCHWEGGTNAVAMDTMNDGTIRTFKTVLSLKNVTQTAPWTWHGWQKDLEAAMHKSLTDTMLGPRPTRDDVAAMIAYLKALDSPPNPNRLADGGLSPAATRGKTLFESKRAGCSTCHSGPFFTDGKIHDVGLNSPKDYFQGYNTPSLVGIYNRVRYLHDGRAKTLDEVFNEYHKPQDLGEGDALDSAELKDLIEYLKSL